MADGIPLPVIKYWLQQTAHERKEFLEDPQNTDEVRTKIACVEEYSLLYPYYVFCETQRACFPPEVEGLVLQHKIPSLPASTQDSKLYCTNTSIHDSHSNTVGGGGSVKLTEGQGSSGKQEIKNKELPIPTPIRWAPPYPPLVWAPLHYPSCLESESLHSLTEKKKKIEELLHSRITEATPIQKEEKNTYIPPSFFTSWSMTSGVGGRRELLGETSFLRWHQTAQNHLFYTVLLRVMYHLAHSVVGCEEISAFIRAHHHPSSIFLPPLSNDSPHRPRMSEKGVWKASVAIVSLVIESCVAASYRLNIVGSFEKSLQESRYRAYGGNEKDGHSMIPLRSSISSNLSISSCTPGSASLLPSFDDGGSGGGGERIHTIPSNSMEKNGIEEDGEMNTRKYQRKVRVESKKVCEFGCREEAGDTNRQCTSLMYGSMPRGFSSVPSSSGDGGMRSYASLINGTAEAASTGADGCSTLLTVFLLLAKRTPIHRNACCYFPPPYYGFSSHGDVPATQFSSLWNKSPHTSDQVLIHYSEDKRRNEIKEIGKVQQGEKKCEAQFVSSLPFPSDSTPRKRKRKVNFDCVPPSLALLRQEMGSNSIPLIPTSNNTSKEFYSCTKMTSTKEDTQQPSSHIHDFSSPLTLGDHKTSSTLSASAHLRMPELDLNILILSKDVFAGILTLR